MNDFMIFIETNFLTILISVIFLIALLNKKFLTKIFENKLLHATCLIIAVCSFIDCVARLIYVLLK